MYIAVNTIATSNEQHRKAMVEAFEKHGPDLHRLPGFLGLELWSEEGQQTILAVSRWESKEAVEGYIKHPMFGAHHGGASTQQMQQGVTYYEAKKIV